MVDVLRMFHDSSTDTQRDWAEYLNPKKGNWRIILWSQSSWDTTILI